MILRWLGFIWLRISFLCCELFFNLVKSRYLIMILCWLGVFFVYDERFLTSKRVGTL